MGNYNDCCVPNPITNVEIWIEGNNIFVKWDFTPNPKCNKYTTIRVAFLKYDIGLDPPWAGFGTIVKIKEVTPPTSEVGLFDTTFGVYRAHITARHSCGICDTIKSGVVTNWPG